MAMWDEAGNNAKCAVQSVGGAMLGQYQPPSDRQKLLQKKDLLQGELARVDAAIKALDDHPDLEAFVKTIQAAFR